ncbi:MAG: hypothetical protein HW390_839 [Candidatus Brocadiaceae bacterium]|nr:hypothetical protein [Candidatus Brocadiaceae bacterium]
MVKYLFIRVTEIQIGFLFPALHKDRGLCATLLEKAAGTEGEPDCWIPNGKCLIALVFEKGYYAGYNSRRTSGYMY